MSKPDTIAIESTCDPGIKDNEERGIAVGCIWRNKVEKKRWVYTGFDPILNGPKWIQVPWEDKGQLPTPNEAFWSGLVGKTTGPC